MDGDIRTPTVVLTSAEVTAIEKLAERCFEAWVFDCERRQEVFRPTSSRFGDWVCDAEYAEDAQDAAIAVFAREWAYLLDCQPPRVKTFLEP